MEEYGHKETFLTCTTVSIVSDSVPSNDGIVGDPK